MKLFLLLTSTATLGAVIANFIFWFVQEKILIIKVPKDETEKIDNQNEFTTSSQPETQDKPHHESKTSEQPPEANIDSRVDFLVNQLAFTNEISTKYIRDIYGCEVEEALNLLQEIKNKCPEFEIFAKYRLRKKKM